MSTYRMLVINPGSTSTKISVFDDRKECFSTSVFHDAPFLLAFPTVNDQMEMRMQVVSDTLKAHAIPMESIDVFIGRGGCAYAQEEGVMPIDKRLRDDTAADVGGSDHPAKLGVMMAYELGCKYHKPMYTVDPTNVDELDDVARLTGIQGLYRRAQTHVLNQKGVARRYAEHIGRSYETCNFIVCHIDGGITITAHRHGRMVDSTEGAGGDGPFSPTRLGSVPVIELLSYLEHHSLDEVRTMCSRSGGLVSYFGTSNSDTIHKMVEQGDAKATMVWSAMTYQVCKSIGAMAAVLSGNVDAIILTGGPVCFPDIVSTIQEKCGWIASVVLYPGEVEQQAMADSVLDVLTGKRDAHPYTGKPLFQGFGWDRQN